MNRKTDHRPDRAHTVPVDNTNPARPAAQRETGRLAPSPTGYMHLGNAWAFWLAWLDARSVGGQVVLRMEDIDPARSRDEYAEALREDLSWLGINWDEESPPQSTRLARYEHALDRLTARGLVYPCYCTRAELRAMAGAPHIEDMGAPYPGTCRSLSPADRAAKEAAGRKPALRLACPSDTPWRFRDMLLGEQSFTLAEVGGDFALCRSDGVFAYQLAVTVDDQDSGVTRVVRGRDILTSTPRQMYLWSLLGDTEPPVYAHLPLLLDHEGERLAKRHQSLSLRALRDAGIRPETLLGFLAHLAGFREKFSPLHAADLLTGFSSPQSRGPGESSPWQVPGAAPLAAGGIPHPSPHPRPASPLLDRLIGGDVYLPDNPVARLLELQG